MNHFRAMVADEDELPVLGRTRRMLGIAIPGDIDPDVDGNVHPEKGGMSVSPGSMWHVPSHRRPHSMARGSTGPLTNRIYAIGEEIGSAGRLMVRLDPSNPSRHAFVEPSQTMALARYEEAISATRPAWRQMWPER